MSRIVARDDEKAICYAFGDDPRRIETPGEWRTAGFERRLEAVWAFLVKQATKWYNTLLPREQANTSIEDAVCELVCELKLKDEKWDPEKAKYITFVGMLIQRRLSDLRDESRTVQSPYNSVTRMATWRRDTEAGQSTESRDRVAEKIRRTRAQILSIAPDADRPAHRVGNADFRPETEILSNEPDPSDAVAEENHGVDLVEALIEQVKTLKPYEAAALGAKYGLFGQEPKEYAEIGESLRLDANKVKKLVTRAREKLRAGMESRGAVPVYD